MRLAFTSSTDRRLFNLLTSSLPNGLRLSTPCRCRSAHSHFRNGLTRLQPAYVEDVAEATGRTMQRAETPSTIFEFGGPRVYSYEEFLGAVAHQAGLAPRLIPIPFAVWHALAWASEMSPSPLLTRNQVELMQIDTASSPEMTGFVEFGISPHSVEAILRKMLSK